MLGDDTVEAFDELVQGAVADLVEVLEREDVLLQAEVDSLLEELVDDVGVADDVKHQVQLALEHLTTNDWATGITRNSKSDLDLLTMGAS